MKFNISVNLPTRARVVSGVVMLTFAAYSLNSAVALPVQQSTDIVQLTVTSVGGAHGMFVLGEDSPALRIQAHSTDHNIHQITLRITAEDLFGKPVAWKKVVKAQLSADDSNFLVSVPFSAGNGYFLIHTSIHGTGINVAQDTELGFVPEPVQGLRKNSFFASNTSAFKTGEDLKFLQTIGMKVERVHFEPPVQGITPAASDGSALPLDFSQQDQDFKATQADGLWVLPIVGYCWPDTRDSLADQTKMYGPPRNNDEFVNTWKQILEHYPDITTYEFWNEPWIFGWNFAGTPAEYRELQTEWCKMALSINPSLRIVAGNSSMFVEDQIESYPDSWKGLLSGISQHPYSYSVGMPNQRGGDQMRSTDAGFIDSRHMGLPYYYITEGGTQYETPGKPDDVAADNNENAYKIVQYYTRTALDGAFQCNAQWEIGYGPAWTRSDTTFAVMTHFLEDRAPVVDIWPGHELLWGGIFANPKFVTRDVRELPRASEISARWKVPGRPGDSTKVAVVWGMTGKSNDEVDTEGTLTIANATGLQAFDIVGRPIPAVHGKLTVPFGQYPVYITTNTLDVMALRARIANAQIAQVTPVNLYALSLTQPANVAQQLHVRIENQMNRAVSGTLILDVPGVKKQSTPFSVPSGRLSEVAVAWPKQPGTAMSDTNQYGVTLTANTDAGTVSRHQVVSVARFARKTITVDGDLGDWKGITPVLVDSDELKSGVDLSHYLLNPNLTPQTISSNGKRIVARVYTAYDARNVYIAAAVQEPELKNTAGTPVVINGVTLPYKNGVPDGLNHVRFCGEGLMFSFGFRDRVPNWGRQMNDPYAWKGNFYDTDYAYAANVMADGSAQLVREWGPDTGRQTAYQTVAIPWVAEVPGAKIVIKRDEAAKLSIYELSLPRTELRLFDPSKGRLRFSFLLYNNENIGDDGLLQWGEAAGVFDYWRSASSLTPSWMQVAPCQTFFGIDK